MGIQLRPRLRSAQAVDLSKNDPDRWITLVKFLVLNKQPVKAAEAIKDAEASLACARGTPGLGPML